MITGINHVTLAVADLNRSVNFYTSVLGLELHALWLAGAYLTAGEFWLCLSLQSAQQQVSVRSDNTHLAFSVPDDVFESFGSRLLASGVQLWKQNTSEGESLYFLDPDKHKLEIHAGNLQSRLASLEQRPYDGLQRFQSGKS